MDTELTSRRIPTRPSRRRLRRHEPRRHRRTLPSLGVLPTLCTLGNLVGGFAAIHYAAQDPTVRLLGGWSPLSLAGALIFLGIFLDAIDGSLARLTRSSSDLGAQLDSLADMVTFGIAPAFMTLRLVIIHLQSDGWIIGPEADTVLGRIIWGAAALYVCAAALRLARYNVEMKPKVVNDRDYFRGLPSPGAAGALASLIILHQHLLVVRFAADVPPVFVKSAAMGIPFIMMACAIGMVSSIRYVHFTNRYVRGARSFGYMVRLVIPLALAIWWFQETLAVLFTVYVLSGPIGLGLRTLRQRRTSAGISSAP